MTDRSTHRTKMIDNMARLGQAWQMVLHITACRSNHLDELRPWRVPDRLGTSAAPLGRVRSALQLRIDKQETALVPRIRNLYALGILLIGVSLQVGAEDAYKVIPVNNGINRLLLDGHDAMVVRGWRENFNAHGFDVASIFVQDGIGDHAGAWSIVPIFRQKRGNDHEELHVIASGGADCQLDDFRLLTTSDGKRAQLILATREPGTSYAAAATVHFDFYVLTENTDRAPGYPRLYFTWQKSEQAHAQYCDVNLAFHRELHLGASSGGKNARDAH